MRIKSARLEEETNSFLFSGEWLVLIEFNVGGLFAGGIMQL